MNKYNNDSPDIKLWTNAKLMDEFEYRLVNGWQADDIRVEIRKRFIRNWKHR